MLFFRRPEGHLVSYYSLSGKDNLIVSSVPESVIIYRDKQTKQMRHTTSL